MQTRRHVLGMMAAGAAALAAPLQSIGAANPDPATVTPIELTTFDFPFGKLEVRSYLTVLTELPKIGKLPEPIHMGVVWITSGENILNAQAVVKDAHGELCGAYGLSPDEAIDNLSHHLVHQYGDSLKASS